MSWLDDLLGKKIMHDAEILPDRKILRFVTGVGGRVTVVDNSDTEDGLGSTDVTIDASPAETVTGNQTPGVEDDGTRYNNTGASTDLFILLPADPVVGTAFYLRVVEAHYMRFQANTGQVIQMDAILSASAGYVRSNYVGASIAIEYVGANKWFCSQIQGPWSADS